MQKNLSYLPFSPERKGLKQKYPFKQISELNYLKLRARTTKVPFKTIKNWVDRAPSG